jgi:hypothetical protein
MTMPHLSNCPHCSSWWCLACVGNLNADLERAEELFHKMRSRYFTDHVARKGQPMVWMEEDEWEAMQKDNAEMQKVFDEQTEAILNGNTVYELFPQCANDLTKHNKQKGTPDETTTT